MKEMLKLGLSLFIFCLVAALALAFTNEMTKDIIAEQRASNELIAKQAVYPDADEFADLEEASLKTITDEVPLIRSVSEAKKGGELIGYVVKSGPSGYGGEIVVITGVNLEGKITGVRVSKHSESPGLGSKSTEPSFYEQYNEMEAKSVGVSKEAKTDTQIKAISAATITSVAVTDGVNASGLAVEKILSK